MLYGKVLWTMYNVPVMEMADSSGSVVHLIQWNWLRSKPTPQEVLEGVSVKRRLRVGMPLFLCFWRFICIGKVLVVEKVCVS